MGEQAEFPGMEVPYNRRIHNRAKAFEAAKHAAKEAKLERDKQASLLETAMKEEGLTYYCKKGVRVDLDEVTRVRVKMLDDAEDAGEE